MKLTLILACLLALATAQTEAAPPQCPNPSCECSPCDCSQPVPVYYRGRFGRLRVRWVYPPCTCTDSKPKPDPVVLEGDYTITGDNYTGTVKIAKQEGVYALECQLTHTFFKGTGLRTGEVLTVLWDEDGVSVYKVQGKKMAGRWMSASGKLHDEMLEHKEPEPLQPLPTQTSLLLLTGIQDHDGDSRHGHDQNKAEREKQRDTNAQHHHGHGHHHHGHYGHGRHFGFGFGYAPYGYYPYYGHPYPYGYGYPYYGRPRLGIGFGFRFGWR
jgi:hypothetical protein